MASHQTFGQRGKILHSQAREIIANVIAFMKHESECVRNNRELTIPIINYKQRVMASTGISEKMYKTITKESKPAGASTSFSTPRKKRPQKKCVKC
ncbi:hypothetical protein MTP99_000863 [Tenebrio molitor]|jgi:hypothetical protein|nr:hypothetical protein MTP99_000863 [Tenebrio molitor]